MEDCCAPTYEELEKKVDDALQGRDAWKELALAQRRALNDIYTRPEAAKEIAEAALRETPTSALAKRRAEGDDVGLSRRRR